MNVCATALAMATATRACASATPTTEEQTAQKTPPARKTATNKGFVRTENANAIQDSVAHHVKHEPAPRHVELEPVLAVDVAALMGTVARTAAPCCAPTRALTKATVSKEHATAMTDSLGLIAP